MKVLVRWILVLCVLGALVAGGVWARQRWFSAPPADERPDMVAMAERRDIESSLLLTGEVKPAFMSEVKGEVGGKIRKIHVNVGDFVKIGTPLTLMTLRVVVLLVPWGVGM